MAIADAPASLSNLGPGFDVLGLALAEPRDRVEARVVEGPGVALTNTGPFGDRVPSDPAKNVAAWAAERVLEASGASGGLSLEVRKEIPPGSGLGSSAASAVAGAVAAARALAVDLPREDLLAIGRDAEGLAAGSAHLDNVAPALLGGFVAVVGTHPPDVRPLELQGHWSLAVVLPDLVVRTADARDVLPRRVSLVDAIDNLRLAVPLLRFPTWHFCRYCKRLAQLTLDYREFPRCQGCGKDGKKVPRLIVNNVVCTYNGKEVFKADWWPAIAANPYLAFNLRAQESGTIELSWTDDTGKTVKKSAEMEVIS